MERLQRQCPDPAQYAPSIGEATNFLVAPHVKGLVMTVLDRNGMVIINLRLVDQRAVWRLVHRLPQALADQQRVTEKQCTTEQQPALAEAAE